MSARGRLEQVVVVPRNGYANRLQAWACASILADATGARLSVLWEPEDVAAATMEDLFAGAPGSSDVVTTTSFCEQFGRPHGEFPRYLSTDPAHDVAVLAGHDRGEQVFMGELSSLLSSGACPRSLIIIAGGLFSLPGTQEPRARRAAFYRELTWSSAVEERTREASQGLGEYAALHVRHTDRSHEAPTAQALQSALADMLRSTGLRSLYVAADTPEAAAAWQVRARGLGYEPRSLPDPDRDRSSAAGGVDALAEWRVLAGSRALVHPAASTYSTEASVASGHDDAAWPLTASRGLQRARASRDLARAVLTYPRRRVTRA